MFYYDYYAQELINNEKKFAQTRTTEQLAQMIENYKLCDRLTYDDRVRLTIYENEYRRRRA